MAAGACTCTGSERGWSLHWFILGKQVYLHCEWGGYTCTGSMPWGSPLERKCEYCVKRGMQAVADV
eukprot:3673962-Prymnesium_polylepis.1